MSQEERLMILQMVSEKKITPAEAAELLREMEGGAQAHLSEPQATLNSPAPAPPLTHTIPPRTPSPSRPPTPRRPSSDGSFGASLGNLVEDLVDRVTSVFGESWGSAYEYPTEVTGEFTGDQIPLPPAALPIQVSM